MGRLLSMNGIFTDVSLSYFTIKYALNNERILKKIGDKYRHIDSWEIIMHIGNDAGIHNYIK